MYLICVGISFKTTSVEVREQMALSETRQVQFLTTAAAHKLPGVNELVILSTCNRTELYAVCDQALEPETTLDALKAAWSSFTVSGRTELESRVGVLHDDACARHLFEVSAGLDSQVIGEPQVLGQVANAFELALTCGSAGAVLSALMRAAIRAGKRVRNETSIGEGALSISSVAAAHSRRLLGDLAKATVLVIGTGEMARGAVTALVRQSVDKLLVTNHDQDHAASLADEWGGAVVPFTQLGQALVRADLVITAVAAPHPILRTADVAAVQPLREGRPLAIFDIALPRNVEPEVGQLAGVQLFNLDDLQAATEAHQNVRQAQLPQAALIVTEELKAFQQWQSDRSAVPAIRSLRGKAETIRQRELELALRRLPDLDDHSRQVIEEFSQRLVNKLLHQPTLTLKEKMSVGDVDLYATILSELFALSLEP
ncbi:MAG TPA: glutamyl-tRNA reductase [Aggregatilineales bacterium]|nr:glutamyl-tRNA reductase [Aggregatilineales bacterium]